jgi:hypothetical protein
MQQMDKGPWTVGDDARSLRSDDFTHDVVLKLSGDFSDDGQRRRYAEELCSKLNGIGGSAGAVQQPVATFWIYELDKGKGVYLGSTDEKVTRQVASEPDGTGAEPGEPFQVFASPLGASAGDAGATDTPAESVLVCYEAYQVVGSLLSDLGEFDTPEAQKILDNLSEARLVHDDVLPWESHEPAGNTASRMLTKDELYAAYTSPAWEDGRAPEWDERMNAVLNKFCEVNGIRLAPPAQQSDSVHSSAPGADVGKTLENATGAGGSEQ